MGTYSSRGLRLSYEEAGAGLPLLLLHAFPFSRAMWAGQIAALSPSCRCLAPDFSGFGGSEPDPRGVCRMEDLAADAAALLDHLGIDRAVVCGLSMGGYAALAFAERFPERLCGLALADTRPGADTLEGRQVRLANAERALREGSKALAEGMIPKLLAPGTVADRQELRRQVESWISEAPPSGVAAALRGMAERPDRTPLLPRIAVPALILFGEEDSLSPVEEGRRMREAIPGAVMETIPGAGHLSNLERPEAFNRAIGEFLDRLPSEPAFQR